MDLCFQEVRNGTGRDVTASQFSRDRTAISANGPLGAGGTECDHQTESVAAYAIGQAQGLPDQYLSRWDGRGRNELAGAPRPSCTGSVWTPELCRAVHHQ